MKLTISELFDATSVIEAFNNAKITGLEQFVQHLSDLSSQTVRIFRSRVSLADNVDCVIKDVILTHNVSLLMQNPSENRNVSHIIATRSMSFANPVTALAWRYTAQGQIELKAQFLNPTSPPLNPTSSKVSLLMYY